MTNATLNFMELLYVGLENFVSLPCIQHPTGHQQLILHDFHDLIAGLCAALWGTNYCDGLLRKDRENRERGGEERERERVSQPLSSNYSAVARAKPHSVTASLHITDL